MNRRNRSGGGCWMQSGTVERPIPFTPERAATELIASRRHLEAARDSLALALRIAGSLNGEWRPEVRRHLAHVLGRLEEAQAALGQATE